MMAHPISKRSIKRSVTLFKSSKTTTTEVKEKAPPAKTNSGSVGLMRKKSRNSPSKMDDGSDLSPTSVGSPVIAAVNPAIEIPPCHDNNTSGNHASNGSGAHTMNADLVHHEQEQDAHRINDFDVPMNDIDVPVKGPVDYGYGDAAPDDKTDYGYGYAAPDDRSKYGYGDAAPDDRSKYGYGDAAPDDTTDYGYGDAAPDDKSKYGYEEAAPSLRKHISSSRRPRRRRTCGGVDDDDDLSCDSGPSVCSSLGSTRSTMRSSMKKSGTRSRRASIQFGGSEISVYLPGHEQPVKRRTSITFNESVRVKKVDPVRVMTDTPEKLWFQDDEFKAIRRRSLDLVDKVDSGKTNGKKYCIRGLEKLTKSRRKQVMERKYNAWDTVLDEQDVQRDSGTFDEDYMANVYKHITQEPQEEATKQGMKDYTEIENYMRSTRRICRRLSM